MNVSKLKYRLKQSLFFYCLLLVVGVYAQRYPVQVTQTIIPPYSTKLSDYATASDVKFRLNVLLTDVVANNKQVRLKLHIKGNGFDIQSTDFVAGASQVILNGGVLQQFTNIDLAAYFQPNNLIGISPQQYNKPLPEGMYSFCWEVYDAYTNQQLNHPTAGCSNVYLVLNDPPFLNLPYKGDQIVAQDPMNIIFQWTPRHTNATNVSYEFELRELWDTQVDPQAAFLASPNYYSETTYTTTLLYNIGKPTLLPNRRYGWRVKAKSTTGVSENSIFKNDGYSEIYYFTYTNACYPPTFVLSEVVAKDRIKLTWQGHPDHKKYHVQYKRADIPDAEWFEVYTYNTQAQISNLREGKTYMFRVGGTCNELTDFDQNYSYSHMSQFTMPAKDEMGSSYNCGIIPEIQIDNNDPLKNIGINETFTAGDFPVTVKQIQGGNGTFTGVGYIVVPYLGDTKIAVTFDAISINTDYQLIEGVVKTTYDPTWGDMGDTNDWTQGGTGNSESTEVGFPVSDVQIDPNGDILVIGENGELVELPGGEDIVITDSNGQVWAVDEEGNVTPQGTQAEGGASNPENTNGVNNNGQATAISAKGVIVTFKKASNSKYGFDGYESNYSATKDLYKKLGNNYYVPYKAVAKNDTETIVANLAITDSKIKPQDIVFKTKDGVAITKIDSTATSYTLQLKGVFDDAEIETQALVKQGTKYEVAGAFIQYQATPKNVKVVVVNTSNTSARTIKESLQNIYQQAMVNLTITEINDFKNDLEALTPNGTIQSGESGFAAQYTEQQRQINNKLKQHSQYQQDAYYLIVTDKTPSSANEKGLMPLGRQFGYIYIANAPPSGAGGLAAHELGHGAFQLKHPFSSQSYQYAQKATNWLLDYKGGTKLPFVHWQAIHNPKLRIGIFDKDGEGEQSFEEDPITQMLQNLSKNSGYKHFAIKHCKECKDSPIKEKFDSPYQRIDQTKLSSSLQEYVKIGLKENEEGNLTGYQLIADGKDKQCVILYYQSGAKLGDEDSYIKTPHNKDISEGLWLIDIEYQEEINCSSQGNDLDFCTSVLSTTDFNFSESYLKNLYQAVSLCIEDDSQQSIAEITDLLKNLQKQVRTKQGVQFAQNGKVYQLNTDGEAIVVQNELTDEQITKGEWEGNDEVKMRFTINSKNLLELKAFGFKKDLPLASGKEASLIDLANHIKEKSNTFFTEYTVRNAKVTPQQLGKNLNDGSTFADGDQLNIDNESSFVKITSEGIGIVTTLLKKAEVEKNVYLEKEKEKTTIHAPGLVTGTVEAGVTAVTDITSMCVMVYDLATDKKTRKEAYDGFVQLKTKVQENKKTIIPIFIDVLSAAVSGNSTAEWKKIKDPDTDKGEKSHLGSRGVVTTVKTVIAGAYFIKELPEIVENVAKKIDDIVKVFKNVDELVSSILKNRKKVREVLDTEEGIAYAQKYFKKYVKDQNFEEWWAYAKRYDLKDDLNFEVHHVIPIKVFEKNKELQELLFWANQQEKKFNFNGIDNGIPLQKKKAKIDLNGHTNHPKYDIAITDKINDILTNAKNEQDAFNKIINLINDTKNKLERDVLLGDMDVNQITSF
ncbi:AHH domain-containing protein [Tenacibaculum mesophilum]|uniref:AHH domain-containing protein n=1 Tax=Tenacibaculum mesophilum TaxID=104268 RepID=UPI00064AC609|nr:AHH domain-containing protein [Tenacibaculum mesophilum]